MKNIMSIIKALLPTRRKIIQLYFALLFNANLKGFIEGSIYKGNMKSVCLPGLNCYSCPGAIGACPLGSLQGSYSADKSTLFYVVGILLLWGIIFGRTICGFMCPFGLIQELLYKIKTPKLKKSKITRALSYIKYPILALFVVIIPVMYSLKDTPLPAFCKYICPAGTLEGGIGLLSNAVNDSYFSMLGPLFTWKFLILVSTVFASVMIFRVFCRFICPLGALYGFFNKFSLFGIKLERSKCTDCGLCLTKCKMDIKQVGDHECIGCGECVSVCPTKAIRYKGPKILLPDSELDTASSDSASDKPKAKVSVIKVISKILIGTIMMLSLIGVGATAFFTQSAPTATEGTEIGDLCYGYELEIIGADGITDKTIDPTKTGKLTIINFWGTWCTPCVEELPYFSQIATEYKDEVCVVAIHTDMIVATAPPFIAQKYPASDIIFAKDYKDGTLEGYYTTLGGRGSYPYTVIIDENGIIIEVIHNKVNYDRLKQIVSQTLGH